MLHSIDPDEDFIDVESVAVAPVFSLQAARIYGSELDTPQTNRFSGYSDASFSQKVFNIPVTQIEAIVEPDCIGNDIGRESVALICVHKPILPIPGS